VVAHGDFTMLLPDDEQVYAFTRRLDGTQLLVLANFSGATVTPGLPGEWAAGELLLSNYRRAARQDGTSWATLPAWGACVLRRPV
jgi:oligo-1,6-glucosidase